MFRIVFTPKKPTQPPAKVDMLCGRPKKSKQLIMVSFRAPQMAPSTSIWRRVPPP
jgi:hypothetical protein